MGTKEDVGKYGEDLVADQLTRAGWRIVARNWRCRDGELDMVAWEGEALVAVEVKTRRGSGYGNPVEAVTPAKASRLRRLLVRFMQDHDLHATVVRIDVVGVLIPSGRPTIVDHIRSAC